MSRAREPTLLWHAFPLGLLGADQTGADRGRRASLRELAEWLPHMASLGADGLLLGPVFASLSHGYDTTDHRMVDDRLGDAADLDALVAAASARGIGIVLDGAFAYASRAFWRLVTHGGVPAERSDPWFVRDQRGDLVPWRVDPLVTPRDPSDRMVPGSGLRRRPRAGDQPDHSVQHHRVRADAQHPGMALGRRGRLDGVDAAGTAADRELSLATALVERLPLVFQSLHQGRIDRGRAVVFAEYLDPDTGEVTEEQSRRLCERFVPLAPGLTTKQLRDRLLRALHAIDPDLRRRRYERAVQCRGVALYMDRLTGTATLVGDGLPADEAAAAAARLDRMADAAKRVGHPGTRPQISADLYLGMLNGRFEGLTEAQIIARLLGMHRPEDGHEPETPAAAAPEDHEESAEQVDRRLRRHEPHILEPPATPAPRPPPPPVDEGPPPF